MRRMDDGLGFVLRYENVAWYEDGLVKILDRRIYPTKVEFVTCRSHKEVAQAIRDMVTQSAGPYTAAGMGMALAAYESRSMAKDEMWDYLKKAAHRLSHARPTTANRMSQVTEGCLKVAKKAMERGQRVDEKIFEYTIESLNRRYSIMEKVGEYLVDMFPDKGNIMTQCFGETIVGMMLRVAKRRNKDISLYVPETRPYFQGARLTASVAHDQGFDTTVITDNMPAVVMETKNIDLFTSAADIICLDGHITNKVGTYQIAIAAKYHGIPYFVTGIPDRDHDDVSTVIIEERDPQYVLEARGVKNTLEGVKGYYPSFDITPPHLISGVVTDKGIFAPYDLHRYFETDVVQFY
ncbi:MAG TPA: S-methyl-5-thioribose-1-phosphate isomerase [Tissierellaceae bacterium]|nr:S-methyl-5-thioribose-1-phosphate isomerase [Tissierellaceae bacterium]